VAFVPWVVLTITARYSNLKAAAAAALAAAIVVSVPSLAVRRPKILELASIAAFAALLAATLITDAGNHGVLFRYERAFAAAALATIAFGSLLFVPFTEQYAREVVPQQLWQTPQFKQTNRLFTAVWGGVFVAIALSHTIAGAIDTRGAEVIFNWVVPIILLVRAIGWMVNYRRTLQGERPGAAAVTN
jgi:tryptophan-rich sensory protein